MPHYCIRAGDRQCDLRKALIPLCRFHGPARSGTAAEPGASATGPTRVSRRHHETVSPHQRHCNPTRSAWAWISSALELGSDWGVLARTHRRAGCLRARLRGGGGSQGSPEPAALPVRGRFRSGTTEEPGASATGPATYPEGKNGVRSLFYIRQSSVNVRTPKPVGPLKGEVSSLKRSTPAMSRCAQGVVPTNS